MLRELRLSVALVVLLGSGLLTLSVSAASSPRHVMGWSGPPTAASLLVGVPYEDAGSTTDAGVVDVIYGVSGSGLITSTSEYFGQTVTSGQSEAYDRYGYALASGDFNHDGFFDIAIGVPYESDGGHTHAGAVNILYGSAAGFTRQDYFSAAAIAAPTVTVGGGDHFGWSLAAGDFDGDGYTDLAVGAPNSDCCGPDAGLVCVLYGGPGGLTKVEGAAFDYLSGMNDVDSHYGWALASADFDGDGHDDLAIGVPGEKSIGTSAYGGNLSLRFGADRDAGVAPGDTLSQSNIGQGVSEDGDQLGWSVAVGDFNGDGHPDLAVGAPGEDIGPISDAGVVTVLYNNGYGISTHGAGMWSQNNTSFVSDNPEAGDGFGTSLASGDFDGSGTDDLAIGVPGENREDIGYDDAGVVMVLFSTKSDGLTTQQGSVGAALYGGATSGREYGSVVAAGDFNRDGFDDLVIGVPHYTTFWHSKEGAVLVAYGGYFAGTFGFSSQHLFTQSDLPGFAAETDDQFGYALGVLPVPLSHRVYLPLVLHKS